MCQYGTKEGVNNERGLARTGFAIFTPTLCQGVIPTWYGDCDLPVVYETELEAQREIVEELGDRLSEFLRGEREFDDAVCVSDFILPVDVWSDGTITTEDGLIFGRRR